MSACVLCLVVYSSGLHGEAIGQHFQIFSKHGLQQQMCKVIRKHFWIQLDKENDAEAVLCDKCWDALKEFHIFYEKIVKVHAVLKNINIDPLPVDELQFTKNEIIEINSSPLPPDDLQMIKVENIDTIVDPLPTEETQMICKKLGGNLELEQNFFDEEVKVEVNDLELLPQAEVIEDPQVDEEIRSNATTPSIESDNDWPEVEESPAKRARGRPKKHFQTEKIVKNEEHKRYKRNSLKENDTENTKECDLSWRKMRIRNPDPKRLTDEEKERKVVKQLEYDEIITKMFDTLKCYLCNKSHSNFDKLRQHFRTDHQEEDSFHILCCGRKFKTRRVLADHICLHLNPEHFKCKVCDRIFQDGRSLEVHEQAHKDNAAAAAVKEKKIFQCDKCPRNFTTKAALQYHDYSKHVPSTEFKFSCPECHKK